MGDNITLEEFRERMSGILSGNSTLDEIISLINTNVMLPPQNREYRTPDRTRPPRREWINPITGTPQYSLIDPNPQPQNSLTDQNPRPTPMRRIIRLG